MSDPRYLPFDWVPRWNGGYYNSSFFEKFYFLSLYTPRQQFGFYLDTLEPGFFQTVSTNRIGHHAVYLFDPRLGQIPSITLNRTDIYNPASGIVYKMDTLGSLLYEYKLPVWYQDKFNNIIFKNLTKVVFTVASTGFIDLNPLYTLSPPTPDTTIVITNAYNDDFFYTIEDPRIINNILYTPQVGTYIVIYDSQTVVNQITSGSVTVSINGSTINLLSYNFDNCWDKVANYNGIKRKYLEDNVSLKHKCQQLPFLQNTQQIIAGKLGRANTILWNANSALSFIGSGAVDFSVAYPGLNPIITETPVLNLQAALLSNPPSGFIDVLYNNLIIDPSTYTVSGSYVLFTSQTLQNAKTGSISVRYQSPKISTTSSSGYIQTLSSSLSNYPPFYTIYTTHVVAQTVTAKITEWLWDVETGSKTGYTNFL